MTKPTDPSKPKRTSPHLRLLTEHNRPAQGNKASGMPASGAGWGGPARGVGTPITREDNFNLMEPEVRRRRIADKAEAGEHMLAVIHDIAVDEEQPGMVRIMAADKFLDRHEGKALARSITATADDLARLSDDELRHELARFGGAAATVKPRAKAKRVPR